MNHAEFNTQSSRSGVHADLSDLISGLNVANTSGNLGVDLLKDLCEGIRSMDANQLHENISNL